MIQVINIVKLREIAAQKGTVILTAGNSLTQNEKVELAKVLGRDLLRSYEDWVKVKGRHDFKLFPDQNMIFMDPVNTDSTYNGDRMADCIVEIFNMPKFSNFVKDPYIVGLPGTTKSERERARQDLLRWFNVQGTPLLTVLCEEAQ